MLVIRLHDLGHTHGTLLISAGVPVKVVSERLGHARVFEQLVASGQPPGDEGSEKSEKTREQRRKKTA